MKIVDCFTFYNEIDLLLYRLTILYEHVDFFVIVEANQTFSGKHKPSFFKENQHLFSSFMDKIILVNVDLPFQYPNIDYSKNEQWTNEHFQRNSIALGIQKIREKVELNDDDLIVITDLDEIIDPELCILCKTRNIEIPIQGATVPMDCYYYNLRCKMDTLWHGAKIVPCLLFKTTCPENIRNGGGVTSLPRKYGWHMSYFGDGNFIQNKIMHFSHQEYNHGRYIDPTCIQQCIDHSMDFFRPHISITQTPIEKNDYLPPQYDILLRKYL